MSPSGGLQRTTDAGGIVPMNRGHLEVLSGDVIDSARSRESEDYVARTRSGTGDPAGRVPELTHIRIPCRGVQFVQSRT